MHCWRCGGFSIEVVLEWLVAMLIHSLGAARTVPTDITILTPKWSILSINKICTIYAASTTPVILIAFTVSLGLSEIREVLPQTQEVP
ncbi:hypothetical protein BCR43DRAFT_131089 [Syncephalastrum racemosum]|uniref:Uncharacterized protein n=1 Tax=Syncephalastrum racemosum TaxID=13706 RepID=A0A1X2HLB2_SYNRA|nr:hypothetical protein BCR43DRAFT_131089 [Syncephalastrum racemosum]